MAKASETIWEHVLCIKKMNTKIKLTMTKAGKAICEHVLCSKKNGYFHFTNSYAITYGNIKNKVDNDKGQQNHMRTRTMQ